VKWTVEAGDAIAGGTVYRMNEDLDAGPIVAQQWCHVAEDWSVSDLWRERLFPMGVTMLKEIVWKLSNGIDLPGVEQDEQFVTYEPPYPYV
jgi:methionyl-tRNA formyltransferase